MMKKRIIFKSTQENWRKEYLGLKCNTVRKKGSDDDVRFILLIDFLEEDLNLLEIEIINTETNESFVRTVTDVTLYEDIYIISWRHKEGE